MDGKIKFEMDLSKINELQLKSLRLAIQRAKHAHHTDLNLRINGADEFYEADWLKHLDEQS